MSIEAIGLYIVLAAAAVVAAAALWMRHAIVALNQCMRVMLANQVAICDTFEAVRRETTVELDKIKKRIKELEDEVL